MTTPTAARDEQTRAQQNLATRDRLAYRVSGRGPQADSRLAQLQRCVDRAERVMAEANAVPAYLGSDAKRRQTVTAANWRSHKAMLRRDAAVAAIRSLTAPAVAA